MRCWPDVPSTGPARWLSQRAATTSRSSKHSAGGGTRDLPHAIELLQRLCEERERASCALLADVRRRQVLHDAMAQPPDCSAPDREAIWARTHAEVLSAHHIEFDFCYRRELAAGLDRDGEVLLRYVIAPAGGVEQVELTAVSPGLDKVAQCVLEQMRSFPFGQPRPEDRRAYPHTLRVLRNSPSP